MRAQTIWIDYKISQLFSVLKRNLNTLQNCWASCSFMHIIWNNMNMWLSVPFVENIRNFLVTSLSASCVIPLDEPYSLPQIVISLRNHTQHKLNRRMKESSFGKLKLKTLHTTTWTTTAIRVEFLWSCNYSCCCVVYPWKAHQKPVQSPFVLCDDRVLCLQCWQKLVVKIVVVAFFGLWMVSMQLGKTLRCTC